MNERTLIFVKPDGVKRKLCGEIIRRFENKKLNLVAMKLMQVDEALANKHYAEHIEKPFFGELVEFITSGPIVAMVWEGPDAVALCRKMMGATKPIDSAPGTIRGDYCLETQFNLVHGSDCVERAKIEIGFFFDESELIA